MSLSRDPKRHYLKVDLAGRDQRDYQVGQTVSIGVSESGLASGALLVYLPPLLGLLLGVTQSGADEGSWLALASAVAGLLAGCLLSASVGWLLRRNRRLCAVLLD